MWVSSFYNLPCLIVKIINSFFPCFIKKKKNPPQVSTKHRYCIVFCLIERSVWPPQGVLSSSPNRRQGFQCCLESRPLSASNAQSRKATQHAVLRADWKSCCFQGGLQVPRLALKWHCRILRISAHWRGTLWQAN